MKTLTKTYEDAVSEFKKSKHFVSDELFAKYFLTHENYLMIHMKINFQDPHMHYWLLSGKVPHSTQRLQIRHIPMAEMIKYIAEERLSTNNTFKQAMGAFAARDNSRLLDRVEIKELPHVINGESALLFLGKDMIRNSYLINIENSCSGEVYATFRASLLRQKIEYNLCFEKVSR